MIEWRNRLHKCMRVSIELVAVAALPRTKEQVSNDDVFKRKSILEYPRDNQFLGRRSGIIERCSVGSCSDGFSCWCLWEALMARDTCRDPGVSQKLTTTMTHQLITQG